MSQRQPLWLTRNMVTEAREHKSRENQKMQQNQHIQQWPKDNKCFTKTREHDIGANERRINNIMNRIECCKDLCGFYCKMLWVLIKIHIVVKLQYISRHFCHFLKAIWLLKSHIVMSQRDAVWQMAEFHLAVSVLGFLSLFYWNGNELLFVVCKTQVFSSDSVCGEDMADKKEGWHH